MAGTRGAGKFNGRGSCTGTAGNLTGEKWTRGRAAPPAGVHVGMLTVEDVWRGHGAEVNLTGTAAAGARQATLQARNGHGDARRLQ